MPRISVIVSVYNAAPYLRASVESILSQTLEDWELIIVDDGSTDESAEVAARFRDSRVRLFRLPTNRGAAAAKNFGIEQARSRFLAFLDADDVAVPRRLQRQLNVLEKVPNAVLGARAEVIGTNGQHLGFTGPLPSEDRFREMLLFRNCLVQSSIALARESFVAVSLRIRAG
jgi:glycosyltransferase involved in cell wall biosynthesis